jgi:GNAT superfamily N-acetyltransferase
MADYYEEEDYPFSDADARRTLTELVEDSRLGWLFVASEEDRLIAYVAITLGFSLKYRGRDAFIDEVFVSRAFRARGLGRQAVQLAIGQCRAAGVRALHLEAERAKPSLSTMYGKLGFKSHDRSLKTLLLDPT